MQHKLAVAEINPLREAGRPGRIEGRGARVLVEVGKREIRRAGSEHSLVSISKSGWYRDFAGVVDQDKAINSFEPILDLLKHRKELGDVPLFVEHCETAVAEVDVTRRWLDQQGRRELSFSFDVLAERHGVPEVACAPSIVGSLLRLPAWPPRSSAGPSRPIAIASRCGKRDARCS